MQSVIPTPQDMYSGGQPGLDMMPMQQTKMADL